jgi:hypothetical protein
MLAADRLHDSFAGAAAMPYTDAVAALLAAERVDRNRIAARSR